MCFETLWFMLNRIPADSRRHVAINRFILFGVLLCSRCFRDEFICEEKKIKKQDKRSSLLLSYLYVIICVHVYGSEYGNIAT